MNTAERLQTFYLEIPKYILVDHSLSEKSDRSTLNSILMHLFFENLSELQKL